MKTYQVNKFVLVYGGLVLLPLSASAQFTGQDDVETGKLELFKDIRYNVEMQGSFSKGKTPLWLNANKYGLSSMEKNNGYLRGCVIRSLTTDSSRCWGIGYGLDIAVPIHYTSDVVIQQAFIEARWLHGVLSIGAKEYPMELKNQTLSSGSQTLGINARPIPQVRLSLPEYWILPFANHWLSFKGHIAFGVMTDERWQHDFTQRKFKYVDGGLYHSKAGYLKIGNEYAFFPLSIELGLEMAAEFGGTPYRYVDGEMVQLPTEGVLKGMLHAFVPGGSDSTDDAYANVAGNTLGSWVFRINYNADRFKAAFYADHFFEDHSQMFLLDYDGYGEGAEWSKKKKRHFFMYSLKDILLGFELNLPYSNWLRNMVFEYLYTKYQSGPVFHDHTTMIPDHLAGMDEYYNHGIYPGWQHWGQVVGNPLYRSPLYNEDGLLTIKNNRFIAYHLGFDGLLRQNLGYRVLATYQEGWGTYSYPFIKKHHNVSFLVEAHYDFSQQWQVEVGYGMDFGSNQMLGHNAGLQITICRRGWLTKKK